MAHRPAALCFLALLATAGCDLDLQFDSPINDGSPFGGGGGGGGVTPPSAPPTIALAHANGFSASEATIWLRTTDAQSVEIERSLEASGVVDGGIYIGGGPCFTWYSDTYTCYEPFYADAGLQPGTRYRYRIRAVNALGTTGWVDAGTAETLPAATRSLPASDLGVVERTSSGTTFVNFDGYGRLGPAVGCFWLTIGSGMSRRCDETYLKFDLSALAAGPVTRATLRVEGFAPTDPGARYEVVPVEVAWSSLDPASFVPPAPTEPAVASVAAPAPGPDPLFTEWDVTALVQGWATGEVPAEGVLLRPVLPAVDPEVPTNQRLPFPRVELLVE